jgi:hypothetical protein
LWSCFSIGDEEVDVNAQVRDEEPARAFDAKTPEQFPMMPRYSVTDFSRAFLDDRGAGACARGSAEIMPIDTEEAPGDIVQPRSIADSTLGLPAWHRPGPGRGHKRQRETADEAASRSAEQARTMREAKSRIAHARRNAVGDLLLGAANHALSEIGSRSAAHRGKDGQLVVSTDGRKCFRLQLGAKAKRVRCRQQRLGRFALRSLEREATRSGGRRTETQIVKVAMEKTTNISALCLAHRRGRATVRRHATIVARVCLQRQAGELLRIGREVKSKPPTWCTCTTVWDETGQRMVVGDFDDAGSWQILVVKMSFAWGWQDDASILSTEDVEGDTRDERVESFEMLVAQMPVSSTSAESLFAALNAHPRMHDAMAFKRGLMSSAETEAIDIALSDAAAGNLRYFAHDVATDLAETPKFHVLCFNHQAHLIAMQLLCGVFEVSFLNEMYAAALFVRMACNFLRMKAHLPRFVDKRLRRVVGEPPARDRYFAEQAIDYLLANYHCEDRAGDGLPANPKKRGRRPPEECVRFFFAIFNGGYDSITGELIHYCAGTSCCQDFPSTVLMKSKMIAALRRGLLRELPPVPEQGKWTKCGPCADFFFVGYLGFVLCHLISDALGQAWGASAAASAADVTKGAREAVGARANENGAAALVHVAPAPEKHDDGTGATTEFDFRKVGGKRYTITLNMSGSEARRQLHAIYTVAMEPLRIITSYFLHHSWQVDRRREPPLLDLLWSKTSILVACSQYYSSLLRGNCSRLALIWAQSGCASLPEWTRAYPAMALKCRQALLLCHSCIRRRLVGKLLEFEVVAVGDRRRSTEDRVDLVENFCRKRRCCLPHSGPRRLQKRARAAAEQLKEDIKGSAVEKMEFVVWSWRHWLFHAAYAFLLSVAAVEREHSMNKRRGGDRTRCALLGAMAVNAEVRLRSEMRAEIANATLVKTSRETVPLADALGAPFFVGFGRKLLTKAQAPKELFAKDWYSIERNQGRKRPIHYDETRLALDDAHRSQSAASLLFYERLSADSKAAATLGRQLTRERLHVAKGGGRSALCDAPRSSNARDAGNLTALDEGHRALVASTADLSIQGNGAIVSTSYEARLRGEILPHAPTIFEEWPLATLPWSDNAPCVFPLKPLPLHPELLRKYMECSKSGSENSLFKLSEHGERTTYAGEIKSFESVAENLVTSDCISSSRRMSAKVVYQQHCEEGTCSSVTCKSVLLLQAALVETWSKMLKKRAKKIGNVAREGLILAHVVRDDHAGSATVHYAAVSEGVGKHNTEAERFSFVPYERVNGGDESAIEDAELSVLRLTRVDQSAGMRSPLDQGSCGALADQGEACYAGLLVRDAVRVGAPLVSVAPLEWVSIGDGFDEARVTGIGEWIKIDAAELRSKTSAEAASPSSSAHGLNLFEAFAGEKVGAESEEEEPDGAFETFEEQLAAVMDLFDADEARDLRGHCDEFGDAVDLRAHEDLENEEADDGEESDGEMDEQQEDEYEDKLKSLGLLLVGGGRTDRFQYADSGEPAGSIQLVEGASGFSLNAACKAHENCRCWLNLRNQKSEHWHWQLLTWLARGRSCDRGAHEKASRDIRVACGMRPRKSDRAT